MTDEDTIDEARLIAFDRMTFIQGGEDKSSVDSVGDKDTVVMIFFLGARIVLVLMDKFPKATREVGAVTRGIIVRGVADVEALIPFILV